MRKSLICFYDMAVSPCSYDFFSFLISAELCRVRRRFDQIKIVFVQGPKNKFREDKLRSISQNKVFFENVIIPGISLMPSCCSFEWIDRSDINLSQVDPINIFPRPYSLKNPVPEYSGSEMVCSQLCRETPVLFESPKYSRDLVESYIKKKLTYPNFITVTIREVNRDNNNGTRSTNIKVWQNVIDILNKKKIHTLVVRDTKCFHQKPLFTGAIEVHEASIHLPFRAALYERSLINFTKNNGPSILKMHSIRPAIYFNYFDNEVLAVSEQFFKKNYGMIFNSQFPMTRQDKLVIWGDEDVNTILSYVCGPEKMMRVGEQARLLNCDQSLASINVAIRQIIKRISGGYILHEDVTLYRVLERLLDGSETNFSISEIILENAKKFDISKEANKLISLSLEDKKLAV